MKSEKRMVGDYTVLCAVNIGFREIILAENEQDKNGERFLCCYGERNDIFQRYSECAVDVIFVVVGDTVRFGNNRDRKSVV